MVVSINRKRGKVMVLSGRLPIPMVKESGAWRRGTFSADDLKDNFYRVTDPEEAEALFLEAKAALEADPSLLDDA